MNFAEWMAVVSGNTDLLQKAKLEGRIAALESEQTIFMRTRHEAQSQLQRYTAEIGRRDAMLERLKRDWDYINEVAPPDAKGKRANPCGSTAWNPRILSPMANASWRSTAR